MLSTDDDIHKLVEQLTASSRRGTDANLTAEAVNIALAALRAYLDKLVSPSAFAPIASFQIETLDDMGLPGEVLATTVDEGVARSTLAKAKRRFPKQEIVMRAKTMTGKRINPAA
jgi:hypothetical protein